MGQKGGRELEAAWARAGVLSTLRGNAGKKERSFLHPNVAI